jgi:hypothetical protein
MHVGIALKEEWLAVNGMVYIYNYLLPAIRRQQYSDAVHILQECYKALPMISNYRNLQTHVKICEILALGLEQIYFKKRELSDAKRSKNSVTMPSDSSLELKQAEDVCKYGISLNASTSVKRGLFKILTRVQFTRTATLTTTALSQTGKISEAQVIMLVESLKMVVSTDPKKRDMVLKAAEAIQSMDTVNVELCAVVAGEALALGITNIAENLVTKVLNEADAYNSANVESDKEYQTWFSCAECLMGIILSQSIQHTMSQSTQNQIRQLAMQHFAQAAEVCHFDM